MSSPYHQNHHMEQRRTRRFQLQLPLSITRNGAERVTCSGLTRNISSSGVLFTAEKVPDLGGALEDVIVPEHEGPQGVILRCTGKGLRADRRPVSPGAPHTNAHDAPPLERYDPSR